MWVNLDMMARSTAERAVRLPRCAGRARVQSIGPRQVALFAFVGRMKYLAILIIAATALSGGAFARDTGPLLRYQLANGLDVILVPDHRVPKVVVDIGYKVGAVNEPPGRSGFAHLFEHLMFMGTPAYPDIDAAYGTVGADINASTWNDYTVYYTRGLASALPYMLAIEADRMANQGAAITAEDLDTQREVVLNEMRQNTLDTLGGSALLVAQAQLYPKGHPYSRSIIGSMADLKMATIADVHGFFDTFYVPNNAVLVVAGDIDPARTKELVAKYFQDIPRGADVIQPLACEPPLEREERAVIEDRIQLPAVVHAYRIPANGTPDFYAVELVNRLLSSGNSSRLNMALKDEQGKAVHTGAFTLPFEHPGLAILFAIANSGVSAEELEVAMDAEVDRIRLKGITPGELAKLKAQLETEAIHDNSRVAGVASNLASAYMLLGSTDLVNKELDRYLAVTAADLQRAAMDYFSPERRVALFYLPQQRTNT